MDQVNKGILFIILAQLSIVYGGAFSDLENLTKKILKNLTNY